MSGLWSPMALIVLALAGPAIAAEAARGADPLTRLHWLQGHWEGSGDGQAGKSVLRRDIACAMGCRFLNVEAQHRQLEDNPAGEFSSALGMWGYDQGRGRLLLHTFDDMASVTTYYEDPAAGSATTLVLVAENRRDGSKARFVYRFAPPDAFGERFELAPHGDDWTLYLENRFARTQDPGIGLKLRG